MAKEAFRYLDRKYGTVYLVMEENTSRFKTKLKTYLFDNYVQLSQKLCEQ